MRDPDLILVRGSTTAIEVKLLDDRGDPDEFVGTLTSAVLSLYEVSTDATAVWSSSGGTPALVGNILEVPTGSLASLPIGRYVGQISVVLSSGSFKTAKFDVGVE